MPAPLTMRELAAQAGVSVTTVSLALRQHPSIPPTTRKRICHLARELGYRPNPMVAALMSQLRPTRRRRNLETLAFLDREHADPAPGSIRGLLKSGIEDRALELGYQLEHFSIDDYPAGRLGKILYTRNIQGVIVAPVGSIQHPLDLRWDHLSGVSIGYSLKVPDLNHIAPNHYQGITLALQTLAKRGFRRIGVAFSPGLLDRCKYIWRGAFDVWQATRELEDRVEPLVTALDNAKSLKAWFIDERPDAVLYVDLPVPKVLKELPRNRAKTIRLFSLDCVPGTGMSGLDQRWYLMGQSAVDLVVAQLNRNERGVPELSTSTLFQGKWMDQEVRIEGRASALP